MNPSQSNDVDLYVKRKSPPTIRDTTAIVTSLGFSRRRMMANSRTNTVAVDLDMVYNVMLMNSKLQFDRPISSELVNPVINTLLK
jgi:hypothetical protein